MLTGYINILFYFAALVAISYLLDRMWMYSLGRIIYIIFAAPGIMTHELCHYLACKITKTRVTKLVLISKEGGSVTHGKPKGGIFGQAFVSMAPFLGIPLFLLFLGFIFDTFLGSSIIWNPSLSGNVGEVVFGTFEEAFRMIWNNIVERGAWWFILYLYLSASLVIALAPSKQDFKNSIWGLLLLLGGLFLWILIMERAFPEWGFPVLDFVFDMIAWIIVVGLVISVFGLILGLPLYLLKRSRSG